MNLSPSETPILLASSSASRKMLLNRILNQFDTYSPDIDETPLTAESPKALAFRLSQQKAAAAHQHYPTHLIIAGDQTASCEGRLLGKPLSTENAIKQLHFCSGKEVTFYSGLCLRYSDQEQLSVTPFSVRFRQLSTAEIEHYVRREQPLWSAGAFKSEELGICLFDEMLGEDITALVGLPLIKLNKALIDWGINPLLLGEA